MGMNDERQKGTKIIDVPILEWKLGQKDQD